MRGKRVSGNQFSKFLGEGSQTPALGLCAFGTRGRPAPPTAALRSSTQSCRKSMPVPPNRFHPVQSVNPSYFYVCHYYNAFIFMLSQIAERVVACYARH